MPELCYSVSQPFPIYHEKEVSYFKLHLHPNKAGLFDGSFSSGGVGNLSIWTQTFGEKISDLKSKIKKLILFCRKIPKLGISAQHFRKQTSDLKWAPTK